MGLLTRLLPNNPAAQAKLLRLRVSCVGLAMDFWKDTPLGWFKRRPKSASDSTGFQSGKKGAALTAEQAGAEGPAGIRPWSGDRIQIMERLWGDGHALPGGDDYISILAKPLGITKEMSVLDLSAKLGAMGRLIAADFGSYVTGLEPDQALVARGMLLSLAAGKGKQASVESYDPETFVAKRKYDCVFARELFYRVQDKEKFLKAVADSTKPGGGQIVFTDYLVDSVSRSSPPIVEWLAREPGLASPLTLPETLKFWKGFGFDMRVAEDQTDFYKMQILTGFLALIDFLAANAPDRKTKLFLLQDIDLWAHRLAAFKHGLRYYRFYGIKYK